MKIDIVSDTICPWCYVGKRKLEQALIQFKEQYPKEPLDVKWRPFQLDPSIPAKGVDRKAYLTRKFGTDGNSKQIYQAILEAGKGEGIEFAFDEIEVTPNTINSHRLIRWAASAGVQHEVVGLLFAAYFEHGRDIGDTGVLEEIAEQAGMDRNLVGDLLANETDCDLIQKDDMLAREMGISGVPTFLIDGKMAISGAQEAATLLKGFSRVMESRDA